MKIVYLESMKWMLCFFMSLYFLGAYAQSYCDNLSFEGIYYDGLDFQTVFIVLNNNGSNSNTSDSDYASIFLKTTEGDSLTSRKSTMEYSLPEVIGEKIIYPVKIHESLNSYKDFPDEFEGVIETIFPDCILTFQYSNKKITNLPNRSWIDCEDYTVIDVIKDRSNSTKYAYAVIQSNVEDSTLLNIGYTSFEFFSTEDESISYQTSSNHYLPIYPSDTFAFIMQFKEFINAPLCGHVKMLNPDCTLPYCGIVNLKEEEIKTQLLIYPNPTSDQLFIITELPIDFIKIFDADGKEQIQTLGESPININRLLSGIYYIHVRYQNGKVEVRRINKM